MYKILVIGDSFSGKTSLVNQFVHSKFDAQYRATITCEFALKIIRFDDQDIRLQLWDVAGQDRLGGISKLFCRDAIGAVVVADITRKETLDNAVIWKEQVDSHVQLADGKGIPMVLTLNKFDLVSEYEEGGRDLEDYMKED